MEIEAGDDFWAWVTAAVVLAVLAFGLIGYQLAPAVAQPLSPAAWQEVQMRQAYGRDLAQLSAWTDQLADLLNQRPDAVGVQLAIARMQQGLEGGNPLLEPIRSAVKDAADGVTAWSLGQLSRDDAVALVQRAQALIAEAGSDDQ